MRRVGTVIISKRRTPQADVFGLYRRGNTGPFQPYVADRALALRAHSAARVQGRVRSPAACAPPIVHSVFALAPWKATRSRPMESSPPASALNAHYPVKANPSQRRKLVRQNAYIQPVLLEPRREGRPNSNVKVSFTRRAPSSRSRELVLPDPRCLNCRPGDGDRCVRPDHGPRSFHLDVGRFARPPKRGTTATVRWHTSPKVMKACHSRPPARPL